MRLDEALPERPATYDDVAQDVAARWRADEIVTQLRTRAEAAKTEAEAGKTLPELDLTERVEIDQARSAFIAATPPAFMTNIFEMEIGDIRILDGTETVVLMRLDAIKAADDSPEAQDLVARLREQQNEALARGLFDIYSDDTLLRAGQNIDPRAINAVNVNFQ